MTFIPAFKGRSRPTSIRCNMIMFHVASMVLLLSSLALRPALAEATAAPAATLPAEAKTVIEFTIHGRMQPPKPDELEKERKSGIDPMDNATEKATSDAVTKAVKQVVELSAQYPKCRFQIVRIVPETSSNPPGPETSMRITLTGEAGCLVPNK